MPAETSGSIPARRSPDRGTPRVLAAVRHAHLTESPMIRTMPLNVVELDVVPPEFHGRQPTTALSATSLPG